MGMSADVAVWFGFFDSEGDGEQLPDAVLLAMGVENDGDGCFEDFDHDEVMERVEALLKPFGCEIIYTITWDYPRFGLGIKQRSVYNGEALDVGTLKYEPGWTHQVTEAAKAIGWPISGEPAFLVAPMYG